MLVECKRSVLGRLAVFERERGLPGGTRQFLPQSQHLRCVGGVRQGFDASPCAKGKLAPDEFPKPIALSSAAFDEAVEDALRSLPGPVRRYLSNVAITVEDVPTDDDLLASDPPLSPAILGLFRGAPYGQKASMDPWSHFPSGIVLYQRNLERFARSRKQLLEEIRITLIHEVGHFLGLDEDELYERGLD